MSIFGKKREYDLDGNERLDLNELEDAFSSIEDTICIADFEGNIERINNISENEGYQTLSDIFNERENREIYQNIVTAIKFDDKYIGDIILTRDGEEQSIYVIAYKFESLKKIFVYMKNTTKYHDKEDELMRELDRQDEYLRSKDLFIANLSHEVRTPINIIVGMTYFLKDTLLDEKQLEYVNKLDEASNLLLEMVNGILDLSEHKEYSIVNSRVDFNFKNLIDGIVDMFEEKVAARDLKLYVNLNIDPNINVCADKSRLSQVFINLLENAVKYTEKGFIEIDAKKIEENNICYKFQFCIKDTGIGIKKEDSLRIFREFSQVDDPTRKTKEGKGMGLAIAKKIVEDMNGKMWVESSMGLGSKFYFNFTLDKSNKLYDELEENQDSEETVSVVTTSNKNPDVPRRILLVEDNDMNIEITKKIIEEINYICEVAKDGIQAIQQIKEKSADYYDLILMDIHMPRYNGYEISKILKRDMDVRTPIVALTATNVTDEIRRENASYIIDYILKPIKPASFKEKLIALTTPSDEMEEKNKKHVLLFGEEDNRLSFLKSRMRKTFEVAVTKSELDAQILLETGFVDVIVVDELEDLNKEFNFINTVKCDEQFKKIPIILINRNENGMLKERAYAIQISEIIENFEIEQCATAIKNILNKNDKISKLENIVEQTKEETKDVYNFLFESMVNLTTSKSKETGGHLKRTKEYMKVMLHKYEEFYNEGLYTDNNVIEDIAMAAVLHDIGKVGIPDSVLNKPGRLNDEEYEIIKSHVTIGKSILDTTYSGKVSNNILNYAKDIVYHHHEKYDGTGYPEGLKGEEISLNSRIMALIDVYDALVNDRVYKKAMPYAEAEEFIRSQSEKLFDPKVVNIFMLVRETLREINDANKDTFYEGPYVPIEEKTEIPVEKPTDIHAEENKPEEAEVKEPEPEEKKAVFTFEKDDSDKKETEE